MALSATILSDPMVLPPAPETQQPQATKLIAQIEIEFVKCDCCGLSEECTPAYIQHVRERYQGHWICGLCAEAIKDEIVRSERLISTEEAMATHMNFCKKFKASGPPPEPKPSWSAQPMANGRVGAELQLLAEDALSGNSPSSSSVSLSWSDSISGPILSNLKSKGKWKENIWGRRSRT